MFVSKRNLFFKSKENGYLLFCGNSNSFYQFDDENVDKVRKMFESGDDSELPEEIKREFIKSGVLLKESDEEFYKRMKFISYQSRFNPYVLNLTLAPTMACNFKCTYCYEGDRVQNLTMTDEIIEGVINFIKKGNYRTLNLTWYGGEPLCSWDKLVLINKKIEELKISVINQSIVTNGSLIDSEKIEYFFEKDFKMIQITLDGNEKTHNERRPMKNGGNSYKTIMSSLDRIYNCCIEKGKKLNVQIRINIDKTNIDMYYELYKAIFDKYNGFFNVYPAFVFKNSESDCHAHTCMNFLETANFVLELAKKYKIPTTQLYPLQNKLTGCGVQIVNTYVIGSNGDIYKCWEDIGNVNQKIGNVLFGLKDERNLSQFYVMNSSAFEEEKCKDCLFLYSCMGGCPRHRFNNKKENKEINPVCITIKNNPKEFLETYYVLKNKK